METNTHYNLEIRIGGGKLALDDADVLEHCRCAPLHSRGCSLLDALLGKN